RPTGLLESAMSHHVTDHLDDYLHDLLPPAAAARVERHVADCPACAAALAAARRRRDLLTAALPPVEPSPGLVAATLDRITDARLVDPAGVPWVPQTGAEPDAQGTCQVAFDLKNVTEGKYTMSVRAATGPDAEELTAPVTVRRDAKLMLSTDKPVYQPGQTVH